MASVSSKVEYRPTQITLLTNETCNLRCRTCFAWTRPPSNNISADEIKYVLSDLREWLGPFKIEIVGGEVFLREDIAEILRFARGLDIHVSLCTNGSLIDEKNAALLVETCNVVNLSLNSHDPQFHDYMRGVNGSHALLMKAADNLIAARAAVGADTYFNIMCILSDVNKMDVVPLFHWAMNKGINGFSAQAVSFPYWRAYDPDWKQKGKMWPKTPEDVAKIVGVVKELAELKKATNRLGNSFLQLEEMIKYFGGDLPKAKLEDSYYDQRLGELANPAASIAGATKSELAEIHALAPTNAASEAVRHHENKTITETVPMIAPEAVAAQDYCKIGYHNLSISQDGTVRICHTMAPIGNIREDHIKNIWFGAHANRLREDIRACDKGCKVLLCNSKEKAQDA